MSTRPFEPVCPPPERLVLPVRVDPTGRGGPTPGRARGPGWRRTGPGLYVPADVERGLPEQRIVEAAALLPPWGAVTGWAALRMWRAAFFDGRGPTGSDELPVPLAVGPVAGRRAPRGTTLSYEPLDPEDVVTISGVPVLRPVPALFHELRRPQPWREAVVALDMAVAARLASTARTRDHLEQRRHWRRASRVARLLDHAGHDSRSPGETRLRLVWTVDAGLARPLENRRLYDLRGNLVCVPDLLDEEAGLVAEYDGAEHLTLGRRVHDDAREEACRRLGLEYVRFTGPDVRVTDRVVRRLLAARSRALFRPPGQRLWTLEPHHRRPGPGWAA